MNKNIILLIAIFFSLSSCNFEEINENPSFPTKVAPNLLLPPINAQMALSNQYDARYIGKYVQYFSQVNSGNNWDLYGYDPSNDNGGQTWRMAYWDLGENLSKVMQYSMDEKRYDMVGIAKIIRAWSWQQTTDMYEYLIKFDQVFTDRLTFDYDTQETAYKEIRKLANEGIVYLQRVDGNSNKSYTAEGDLIYKGDKEKWIKFAYGLLARNYNNLTNKSDYNADKVIEYVDKSFQSELDDCYVNFAGTNDIDANFFGPIRDNMNSYRQTDLIVRTMNGTLFGGVPDPRMANVLVPSEDKMFRGNKLNTTTSTNPKPNATTPRDLTVIPNLWGTFDKGNGTIPGRYLFRDKASYPLMTYTELQFIKAEAALIKGDNSLALIAYKKAIEASINFVNKNTIVSTTFPETSLITNDQKKVFLENSNIVPPILTLKHIMLQKYVALFGFGYLQTWNDMRKYHYDTKIYETFATNGFYPNNAEKIAYKIRPRYNSEYVWNFDALRIIGADKPNYHTEEMWFSQKN